MDAHGSRLTPCAALPNTAAPRKLPTRTSTRDGCPPLKQSLAHVALIVKDYDKAIEFFTKTLKFELIEDTPVPEQSKRWVLVAPRGTSGANLLLARASNDEQRAAVGNQTGGRVAFFLRTDDFWRDHADLVTRGVRFVRGPNVEAHGTVGVFEDLYGNLWDLIGPTVSRAGSKPE
jgi:catechol 2,3-dioxygenase-like lactoylglutathione lyase family enzyme